VVFGKRGERQLDVVGIVFYQQDLIGFPHRSPS
jgi:hypothetical protein